MTTLPPRAVVLTADIALIAFHADDDVIARSLADIEPPYGTVEVTSSFGPGKIAAARLSAKQLGSDHLDALDQYDDEFAPIFLGSDVHELSDELDEPSRRRLLAFLLGFCRKAFDLASNADFAASCMALAKSCIAEASVAQPIARLTPAWTIVTDLGLPPEASLFRMNGHQVRRTRGYAVAPAKISVVERLAPGDVLLALCDEPQMWTMAAPSEDLRDLMLARSDHTLRASCLKVLAPVCDAVRATALEMGLLSPAAPVRYDDPRHPLGAALEAALPDGQGRLFIRGWIRDPLHLVETIELQGPLGKAPLLSDMMHRFRRPDVGQKYAEAPYESDHTSYGFVGYVQDPSAGLSFQSQMCLTLRGGHVLQIRSPVHALTPSAARNAVLSSVPADEVTDEMLQSCLGPAAATFHRSALARSGEPTVVRIGKPRPNPSVSVLIPLYRTLSFLRFQLAAFATDPGLLEAEFIFVLDSPEQRTEVEHLLRGLHAVHDIPMLLIILPRNMGYAAANNIAAQYASSSRLLLLNSDVIPAASGWLKPLLDTLQQRGIVAVGPKLLFEDESIQHAGLLFCKDDQQVWLNGHYYKGMPRRWPAANVARVVPGLTGAALLVKREAFDRVGGICEDYVIGDYEDSDLCLRLRSLGDELAYVPESELYHFERRSITQHKGYTGTLACRYNRLLHHNRWSTTLTDLMDRPDFRLPSAGVEQ